jgi:hypothetical protein
MTHLLAQQTEYGQMWALVCLMLLLGVLVVAVPRFRRVDLLTDQEKKKLGSKSKGTKSKGPAGH